MHPAVPSLPRAYRGRLTSSSRKGYALHQHASRQMCQPSFATRPVRPDRQGCHPHDERCQREPRHQVKLQIGVRRYGLRTMNPVDQIRMKMTGMANRSIVASIRRWIWELR